MSTVTLFWLIMTLKDIKNRLIPNYYRLTPDEKNRFEQSEAGKKFTAVAELCLQISNDSSVFRNPLDLLFLGFSLGPEELIQQERDELIQAIKNTEAYKAIQTQIATHRNNETMHLFQKRAQGLARKVPGLTSDTPELLSSQHKAMVDGKPSYQELEKNFLSAYFQKQLNEACSLYLNFIPEGALDELNRTTALKFTTDLIAAYEKEIDFDLQNLLKGYRTKLVNAIKEKALTINGKNRALHKEDTSELISLRQQQLSELLKDTLSNLFTNSGITSANHFVSRLAEAHAFLTNTGFSSQNDNIVNTILELYNTNRVKEEVHESKQILGHLFSPLRALYEEFKDITVNEKNKLAIFLRTIAPIIILIGFIMLVSVALAPLAIPEVLTAFLLIPIVYMSLAASAAYVTLKNNLWQNAREWYYGGPYNIPEYQINNRIYKAYNSLAHANILRDYYVQELQRCQQAERQFADLETLGELTEKNLKDRENNMKRHCTLLMEWFDIHSNARLGIDTIPELFNNRLNTDFNNEYESIQTKLFNDDRAPITASLDKLINHVETKLTKPAPAISSHAFRNSSTPTLFKPKYQEHQDRARTLDFLINWIR